MAVITPHGAVASEGAVHRGAGDREQLLELADGVPARPVQGNEVGFLRRAELGLLTSQPPLGPRDLHPLPSPHPGQIRLELSDHRQHVEQQSPDRVGGVVHRPTEAEVHGARGELFGDRAGSGKRTSEPVELRHDEGVAAPARGQRLGQAGTFPGGSGQAVVDVIRSGATPSAARASRCAVRSCASVETRA